MSDAGPVSIKARREAAAALLVRHHHALYGYIMACLRSQADADDVLQNVAMAVIESDTPPETSDDFMRWAREIARRRILEFQRTNGRVRAIPPELVERLVDASARLDENEGVDVLRTALLKCLDQLPKKSQDLLAARYSANTIDIDDLAKQLKRSVTGLYQVLYRLRDVLRECVDRRLEADQRT